MGTCGPTAPSVEGRVSGLVGCCPCFLVFGRGRFSWVPGKAVFGSPPCLFCFYALLFVLSVLSYRITDSQSTDDEKSCMLLVMRVLSIVPLSFKVRYFTASQPIVHRRSYAEYPVNPNLTATSMVSSTVPGTSRLQFLHPISVPFSPDAFGSHHT